MQQQLKQYLEQNKYSPYPTPIQRNGFNSGMKIKSITTQFTKQSTINQLQDLSPNLPQQYDANQTKNVSQVRGSSKTISRKNSKTSSIAKRDSTFGVDLFPKFQHSRESFKYSVGEQTLNQPSQNTLFQNRLGQQKSRIFNNQQSFRYLNQVGSDHNQNKQGSVVNPSTVIFAIQEKAQIEQEDRLQKKRKKIKDVLIGKSREEIFAKGLRHFRDANLLRPPRNIFDRDQIMFGKYFLHFYELRWTIWWRILQRTLSYLFIIQTFLEPQTMAQKFSDSSSVSSYVYYQEIIVLTFCLLDNILSLYLYRSTQRNNLFKFISFTSQFSIIIIFLVDFILFWYTEHIGIRFSAVLRPIWLIQFHNDIYKTLKSIFLSFKKVIDIFLFFIFFSSFWGYMGYNLFSEYAVQFADDKYFVFGSVGESILGMYTLISMDTYPSIMRNIVIDNPYYLIFFVPYVSFNLFFLLFIPVAVIFENYKKQRASIILKDDKIIKEALIYSFYCITHYNEEDNLSKDQFFSLLDSFYGNKALRDKIDNLYSILNIDKQDQMSLGEFLDVIDLMKTSERLYENSNKYWDYFRKVCNEHLHCDKISKSNIWNYFILFIVTVNTVMIIVYSVLPQQDQTDYMDELLTNIDICFNTIYIIDVIIKVVGLGLNEYFNDYWNNFDFIMVMISIITIFGLKYIYFLKQAKSTKLIKLTKLQRVLKIFRSIRSLKLFKILKLGTDALLRVQKLFHKVALCIPSIYGLLYTYFLFTFSYAIIGTYLFNTDYNSYKIGSPYDDNSYTDFNTLFGALLSLFQVITQSRWVDFLYGYGYKFNLGLSTAYFCSYHMFSILFFMSLLQGMIWDVFGVVEDYFKEQEMDDLMNFHYINPQQNNSQEQFDDEGGIHSEQIPHKERIQTQLSEDHNAVTANQIRLNVQSNRIEDKFQQHQRSRQLINIQIGQQENESQIDEESNLEKDVGNLPEILLSIPNNTLLQRPRMSTYHYMKQDKVNISQTITEEKEEFDFKERLEEQEEVEEVDEEKSNTSNLTEEKSNNFFTKKKPTNSEMQFRSINPHFRKQSNRTISYKETEQEEIEEQMQKDSEGNFNRGKITSEENRFIIRFNLPTGDSDTETQNTQLQSPLLIQTQSSSPQNLQLTVPNQDDKDHLLNSEGNEVKEVKAKNLNSVNNKTLSTNHTPQKVMFVKKYLNSTEDLSSPVNEVKSNIIILSEKKKMTNKPQQKVYNRNSVNGIISQNTNFFNKNQTNLLSIPKMFIKTDSENATNSLPKKPSNLMKRSESTFISRENDKFFTSQNEKVESDFDKYYRKRVQVIRYEVDLMTQLSQLEKFLQLYDQVGLKQAELRKNRILTKHQNMNHFTISKQHALHKMTYLKDHPANILYSNRQNYLQTTEQLIGNTHILGALQSNGNKFNYHSIGQSRFHNQLNSYSNNQNQRYHSQDNQGKGYQNEQLQGHVQGQTLNPNSSLSVGRPQNNNYQTNNNNIDNDKFNPDQMTLTDIDDIESNRYEKTNKSPTSNKHKSPNDVQFSEELCHQQSSPHDNSMNDQTFLRLNNIFSFLLHLLTNSSNLESQFLIQKLFIIEQSINQVIFGNYNENHKVNHFKFVFYSPSSNKFVVLVKQHEMTESITELDEFSPKNQIQQPVSICSLPNENTPWSAITKSMQNENTIYFVKSLFSQIATPKEREIANVLSDNIQFMRGYEYCKQDLTNDYIEQYTSFICSRQSISSSIHAQQRLSGTGQSFIAFICNRQTYKHNMTYNKSNQPSQKQFNPNLKQHQQDKPNLSPKHSTLVVQQQSKLINKNGNHKDVADKNGIALKTTNDVNSNNNQIVKQLLRVKNVYRNQDIPIEPNFKQDQAQEEEEEEGILEKSSKPPLINDLERKNKKNISQILENRNKIKLMREQEQIIKIYHQIQQFFGSHSHLLQSIIIRLQTQIDYHIPSYENN